jgi:hypothetical protein
MISTGLSPSAASPGSVDPIQLFSLALERLSAWAPTCCSFIGFSLGNVPIVAATVRVAAGVVAEVIFVGRSSPFCTARNRLQQ